MFEITKVYADLIKMLFSKFTKILLKNSILQLPLTTYFQEGSTIDLQSV